MEDRLAEQLANWSVDIFFKSLAHGEKALAIGIILSGAGSDGTSGSIAIHNEQGLVMVQDPQTADFASMPQSVILRDHPARILSPARLAQALMALVSSPQTKAIGA